MSTGTRYVTRLVRLAGVALIGLTVLGCTASPAATQTPAPPQSTAASPTASPAPVSPTPAATPTTEPGVPLELPDGLSGAIGFDQLTALVAYHDSVAFDIAEAGSKKEAGGVTVRDITYAGEGGQRVAAYLVVPAGKGPFPAILFEHGMGDDRDQFRDAAVLAAQKLHAVGLVPTRPTTASINGTGEAILQIREMRHGLDLLAAQPGVDKARLGYVGFSMGACIGSQIVAVEPRIKAAVMMAAVPDVGSGWIDAATVAPHATTAKLFFEFGEGDSYYDHAKIEPFVALYPGQPKVGWYPVGHEVAPAYVSDGVTWLGGVL